MLKLWTLIKTLFYLSEILSKNTKLNLIPTLFLVSKSLLFITLITN